MHSKCQLSAHRSTLGLLWKFHIQSCAISVWATNLRS